MIFYPNGRLMIDTAYNIDGSKESKTIYDINGQKRSMTKYKNSDGKIKRETVYFSDQSTEQHAPVKKNAKKLFIHKLAVLGSFIVGIALIARGCASRQDNTPPAQVLNTQHQR